MNCNNSRDDDSVQLDSRLFSFLFLFLFLFFSLQLISSLARKVEAQPSSSPFVSARPSSVFPIAEPTEREICLRPRHKVDFYV